MEKKEIRATMPASANGATKPLNPATAGGRSNTWCIGLLIVAITLQLYLIQLWLNPPVVPDYQRALQARVITPPAPDHTLAVITRESSAEDKIRASEVNTLADSNSALTALHLLQKYIRMNRDKLELNVIPTPVATLSKEGHAHNHGHVHDATESEINVGKGIVMSGKTAAGADSHEHDHHAGDNHDEDYLNKHPNLYHKIWLNVSATWADDVLHPGRYHKMSEEEKSRTTQCLTWFHEHHVMVDANWGTLPQHLHGRFDELKCSDVVSLEVTAKYIQKHAELYDHVWAVPQDRQVVKAEKGFEDKVIATIVCITTRSLTINNAFVDLALFKDLFPSFVRTVEPGFEYWFYLGYDKGDPWLDNADHLAQVQAWFNEHVATELKRRDIIAKLVLSTWENPYRKPGPAFNHVTGVAYADGATWIYRINDDQSFDSPWAKAFVDALVEMGPPYGVVGPACGQGATHILVVDFVHRTHHEIFPTHYPPSLMAWWMDNWVSQVYGRKRTKRVKSAKITHLTGSHGTRYDGYYEIGQYMRGEIIRGRAMFEEYLSHTPGMKSQLESYRADIFSYTTR